MIQRGLDCRSHTASASVDQISTEGTGEESDGLRQKVNMIQIMPIRGDAL